MSNVPPPPSSPGDLPPIPPSTPMSPVPPPPADPRAQVQGPAIFMMVGAAFFILYGLYLLATSLLGLGVNMMGQGGMDMLSGLGTAGNVVWAIVAFGLGGLIIFGALQMMKLRNYNMAMAAAVVSLLPCSGCCCIINLAAGIWALVVLMKPEVKAAFSNNAGGI